MSFHDHALYHFTKTGLTEFIKWLRVNGERHRGNLQKNGLDLYRQFLLEKGEQLSKNQPNAFVLVPCAEDDPDCCGTYTSNDGRSLGYVKEKTVLFLS